MAVMLAREVRPGDVLGVGLASPLGTAAALARAESDPSITIILQSAINPLGTLADVSLGIDRLSDKALAWIDHGVLLSFVEAGKLKVQFLRPAQIDAFGNLNTSRVRRSDGSWLYLPGGMAQADSAVLAGRIVAYHPDHRLRSLPAEVDFITASGKGLPNIEPPREGVVALVTNLAVIRFESEGPRLAGIRPGTDRSDIVRQTGFALRGVREATELVPSESELEAIRRSDPDGLRLLEFPNERAAKLATLATS
jgi:glutaconate CoA-transferase subunit B